MEFRFINHRDPILEKVMDLGKKNSGTLGLMPRDAFIDHAKKRWIVVALINKQLAGYCLFRLTTTKHRVGITQVCIDPEIRNQSVAKSLLAQVRDKYSSLFRGMLVTCREDYIHACKLWDKFGFKIIDRIPSRSIKEERHLLKFWYSFGKPDLFSQQKTNLLSVALDLNILIKLHDQNKKPPDEIAHLMADWLTSEVDYGYAHETFNEIHRDKDHNRTASMRKFLTRYTELSCDARQTEPYLKLLEVIHPGDTENHISDRKQLAECKTCGVTYFVTMDEGLLDNQIAIFEQLGINVLRPAEFILKIDELTNHNLYEPVRLQGATFEVRHVHSNELITVVDSFLQKDKGEVKSDFQKLLHTVVAKGKEGHIKLVISPDGEFIATYAICQQDETSVIPFIRLKKSPLFNTLFYQLLVEMIRTSISIGKQYVMVNEQYFTSEQLLILDENGFYGRDGGWVKKSILEIDSFDNIISRHKLSASDSIFAPEIEMIKNHRDPDVKQQLMTDLEKKLWPVKFEDLDIPTFVVPIRPLWAWQLFDNLSSNEQLFGAPPELSWSKNNVYYRSVRPNVEQAPARILWYVSHQANISRSKCIVGCSYLNEISVGRAKTLFSSFRRFGIYKWREIFKLAGKKIDQEIKALQFSDTEIFVKTISFSETNEIMQSLGYSPQTFVSPVKVNSDVFNAIYRAIK